MSGNKTGKDGQPEASSSGASSSSAFSPRELDATAKLGENIEASEKEKAAMEVAAAEVSSADDANTASRVRFGTRIPAEGGAGGTGGSSCSDSDDRVSVRCKRAYGTPTIMYQDQAQRPDEGDAAILTEYQLWPHGYVAAATLRASRRALELLAVPHHFDALVAATEANAGHLQVALRTLRALGWVLLSDAGEYEAPTATLAAARCEPLEALCEAVYSDAPGMVARLAAQLRQADDGWAEFPAEAPAALRTMLTGAVLAPLLLELHMHHMEEAPGGSVRLSGLDGATLELLAAAFRRRGLCASGLSDGGLQLTESGRFVVQRSGAFGVALSYGPMLRQLDTVLFGDLTGVFTHDDEGHEAHVDRTMNVIGSGFMHGKFFDDMMSLHVGHTFHELPLDQQPSIVADTGCGDGTLLLRLYEYVRDYTLRGKHLENRPLLMVGVDFNGASLLATAETLGKAGVPFETMFGDIGDPETIHKGLCSRFGARDEDDVLHVRSFSDHYRRYLEPTDDGIGASALEGESDAAYVHPDGGVLTRALTYRNLVEHVSSGPQTHTQAQVAQHEAAAGPTPGPTPNLKPNCGCGPNPDAALGIGGGSARAAATRGALTDGVGYRGVHGRGDVAPLRRAAVVVRSDAGARAALAACAWARGLATRRELAVLPAGLAVHEHHAAAPRARTVCRLSARDALGPAAAAQAGGAVGCAIPARVRGDAATAARASSERPIRCLRWQWHAACRHVHAARGFAGGDAAWSKHVPAHSAGYAATHHN